MKFLVVCLNLDSLVISCLFKLGLQDRDCSIDVRFPSEGAGNHCCKRPTYKLPIISNMSFFNAKSKNSYWLD